MKTRSFKSIHEFEQFISETEVNSVFRGESQLSKSTEYGSSSFSGVSSYEEAQDMLVHGSDDLSKKLESRLNVVASSTGTKTRIKAEYDVCGFQASVPRYLQGVPTAMVNSKRIPQKQKVVTFNKAMTYSAMWSKDEIINESAKALAIVKKVEAMGIRVNVNLCLATTSGKETIGLKIRLKNASERLNISKMAFMMAHPAMLRRIIFRFIEVNPDVTEQSFASGYGRPSSVEPLTEKGEHLLPAKIDDIDKVIESLKIK